MENKIGQNPDLYRLKFSPNELPNEANKTPMHKNNGLLLHQVSSLIPKGYEIRCTVTSSHLHGSRKMVSYTLSRSFSLPRVVVLRNEFPLYISSMKYFNGDFSKEEESDIKMYNQK